MENYSHSPTPEHRDIPDYLEYFTDEDLEAYDTYLKRTGKTDCEQSALEFEGDYWGVYNSIDEFTRNWDYQSEPLESVQSLLMRNEDLIDTLTLSEIALIDRLSDDMDFLVEGRRITIFNKQPDQEEQSW